MAGETMSNKSIRRSLSMTPEMAERLKQIARTKPRNITEADLIREAIRRYLDEQEDLTSSRKHFQRSFRERIDQLEAAVTFQLNVLVYLLALDEQTLRDAIIAAKQDGETLLAQMKAVRELKGSGD
jgi:predicted DNA-binding protein